MYVHLGVVVMSLNILFLLVMILEEMWLINPSCSKGLVADLSHGKEKRQS